MLNARCRLGEQNGPDKALFKLAGSGVLERHARLCRRQRVLSKVSTGGADSIVTHQLFLPLSF